jgi:hypothetical protein
MLIFDREYKARNRLTGQLHRKFVGLLTNEQEHQTLHNAHSPHLKSKHVLYFSSLVLLRQYTYK